MLKFPDNADYERAREVLEGNSFTQTAISQLLDREEILTMPTSDIPRVLRKTRALSPLDTLIRLFFLGIPTPAKAVRSALSPMSLHAWVAAGLLQPPDANDQVNPHVQIWPVNNLLLAVDLPWRRPTAPEADFVVPPGPLTLQLANAMLPQPGSRVLDLGTGSGALALLAASFADSVTATDVNQRALALTRFNAQLNSIDNIRCQSGNLFEPVAEERFQLIVCNPPFVISPTQRFLYRDSGERGDVFCRRLVRDAVNHLEIGGFLQCTANVAHQEGRSWKEDLESWFKDLDGDVLILVQRTESASDYIMDWILSTESKEPTLVSQRYGTWMDYFARERIEAVSTLLVTLRRSAGASGWLQIDDPPCEIAGPCSDEIEWFFHCRDRFGSPPKSQTLLDHRLRLSTQVVLEEEYVMGPKDLEVHHSRLKKIGGLRYPMTLHGNVVQLLAGCNGERPLRQMLEELFASWEADWDPTLPLVLPVVQSLLERGVLVLA